jgi:uncharacterized YigZ family protein
LEDTVYKTVLSSAESQYRVMASKHLGFIFPVTTEDEIKLHLERLKKEHHQANHICFAWRLGWDKSRFRLSDAGEPSGTAGRPIFGQIQSYDLTNVLIAVVRYFGGTKLGTGGLIEAYRTTARLAIEEAGVIERRAMDQFRLQFPYEKLPEVMRLIKEAGMEKSEASFGETCVVSLSVLPEWVQKLEHWCGQEKDVELHYLGRQ